MKEISSLDLYRMLLRLIDQKLPLNSKSYYRSFVKNQFISHKDETDMDRIAQMQVGAKEKAEWIVKKYQRG